ncbi:hypothetical protein [Hyphomonas sp. UBA4494]|jgi:hypothetical protein|uniref:hypothetical protein n=1 Tax=Hyphomonas sp. UBA4494 TaxID=1946631 RepID=UPI0025C63BC7|nr:hypothetical protein [Hyphomonas sp. UBA4494]
MQFQFNGVTYPFNQLFDGWRLAMATTKSAFDQQPVALRLNSGAELTVRYQDCLAIERQLFAADTTGQAEV